MRLLNDNIVYEFAVEQRSSRNGFASDSDYESDSSPAFRIVLRYRKFQAPIRRPVTVTEQSLDLSLDAINRGSAMSSILVRFEIPPHIAAQMADHFKFFTDRLARRTIGRGKIAVTIRLDVKALSPDTAGEIRTRMESAREADAVAPMRRRRREETEPELLPVRSVMEVLEKVRVGDGGSDCAICLEELTAAAEAARLPCGHVYHCDCIVEWLRRTRFCPFCRLLVDC